MQKKISRRVTFSPDVNDKPRIYPKRGCRTKVDRNKKKVIGIGSFNFSRISVSSGYSASEFFRHIGENIARALQFVRSSRKVSSASLARSKSYAETLDSQRAEAIEDCIEFLNSFSSLKRSNSVNSSC
ncbi:unnamed protein product [Fraxinus pennsylvanica]|uniref:Josephin-like protein n=1 Tax=Fraxinus pennsylvanica TaxID=56036 RepID=A0AAD2A0G2_9LAMI|nr:unnamed protein product [Fraxinus pennsylvanica]